MCVQRSRSVGAGCRRSKPEVCLQCYRGVRHLILLGRADFGEKHLEGLPANLMSSLRQNRKRRRQVLGPWQIIKPDDADLLRTTNLQLVNRSHQSKEHAAIACDDRSWGLG